MPPAGLAMRNDEHMPKKMTTAADGVAQQVDVGRKTVRRWVLQAQIDRGQRGGVTTEELAEIKRLKAENRRLREEVEILRAATTLFGGRIGGPALASGPTDWAHGRSRMAGLGTRTG